MAKHYGLLILLGINLFVQKKVFKGDFFEYFKIRCLEFYFNSNNLKFIKHLNQIYDMLN